MNPSFKPLKQENNNYIASKDISKESKEKQEQKAKLMRFVEYKIDDIVEKDIAIESFSSYAEKVVNHEMRKAEVREQMILDKLKRMKQQEQQDQPYIRKVPFYNWLDGKSSVAASAPAGTIAVNPSDFAKDVLDEMGIY